MAVAVVVVTVGRAEGWLFSLKGVRGAGRMEVGVGWGADVPLPAVCDIAWKLLDLSFSAELTGVPGSRGVLGIRGLCGLLCFLVLAADTFWLFDGLMGSSVRLSLLGCLSVHVLVDLFPSLFTLSLASYNHIQPIPYHIISPSGSPFITPLLSVCLLIYLVVWLVVYLVVWLFVCVCNPRHTHHHSLPSYYSIPPGNHLGIPLLGLSG